MYPHGGSFRIDNKDIYNFYEDYTTFIQAEEVLGVLEKPLNIGPMIVDVDIKMKSKKLKPLHSKERTFQYAKQFQKILLETIIGDVTKGSVNANVECWILVKDPYLDGKGNCKHGFHLHFPFIWMNKEHRMYITQQVSALKMELDYETLDSSACRNCWLLYGSKKDANQGFYKIKYILDSNGMEKEIPKEAIPAIEAEPGSDMDWLFEMLSIRYNPTKNVCKIPDELIPKPKPKIEYVSAASDTSSDDVGLISRCMDALDFWRADDYHAWIRVGCILYTIDKENGFHAMG